MRKCGRALRFDISSDAIPNLSRRPVSGLRRRSKVVMCQQGVQRRLELQPLQQQVLRPAPQLSLHPPDLTTHQPAGVYQFRKPNRIADQPADPTADQPTDQPTDPTTDQPADSPADQPTDHVTADPTADPTTDQPADSPADSPTDSPADQPTDHITADRPAD